MTVARAGVAATFENPDDWDAVTAPIAAATGVPLTVSPQAVLATVGSCVALLRAAQVAGDVEGLRGTFVPALVAQCAHNVADLMSGEPRAVDVRLAGGRVAGGAGVIRVHVTIHGERSDGRPSLDRQFWDLTLGTQVVVAQASCPNCGASLSAGELICGHCGADVRAAVDVPIAVSHLTLY